MAEDAYGKQRVSPFLRQSLAVSGVVLYMIGTGANIAFPGVLLQQLREPDSVLQLTDEHESWIASILGLALVSGIAIAPICLQRLGRRLTNQLSTLPALGGWALMVAATGPTALLISRTLQGFGMGLQAAAAPVSIAEYSSPKLRGAFLATIAFSFATGMLFAHVFGTMLYWRSAAIACGSVYAISLILISLSPETPPYLASKGKFSQCRTSFRWLRGHYHDSEKELEVLLNSQRMGTAETTAGKTKLQVYLEIVKKPEFYKPTVIMMFMFVLFQISGMTVVPSYTVPMMNEVTDGAIEANTSMLMVDVVRFVTSIMACVVVNKLNRRTVLFIGIIISVVSLFITALLLYLRDFGYITEEYKWIPVIPTLFYIFGKTLGILPIPWAIAGEIFPLAYRSLGSGISGMFLSIMFFVVVKTAPTSFKEIGVNGTFLVYGMCIAFCGAFLYFLLPETKGKTLYEIECHFKGIDSRLIDSSEKDKMLELETLEEG
ncbi:facilitated trehalose transporter Tret1-like [Leguminivora glycinivorella]|uniref:facilitated trehalose transporter Tret1-like n=1 Tax=Leguminivora glycinivorella TaxID=1035111 RepID=UPI00200DA4F1|nr:facilitated trehalose transporter Tret1-like [Leguminivora glycinivorella]XP_048000532.1 facilitated trehalose transporter Tret1-like [Leguminivora glycinivorella]